MKQESRKQTLIRALVALLLVPTVTLGAKGPEEAFKKFFEEFQKGAYPQAIQAFQGLPPNQRQDTKVLYWEAVAHTKGQRFDLAAPLLEKVVVADKEKKFE